jgi:hypothetical protein
LSRNLGTLTFWNPLGNSKPVTELLYLLCKYIYDCFGHKVAPMSGAATFITTVILVTNITVDFMGTMFIIPCLIRFNIIINMTRQKYCDVTRVKQAVNNAAAICNTGWAGNPFALAPCWK